MRKKHEVSTRKVNNSDGQTGAYCQLRFYTKTGIIKSGL